MCIRDRPYTINQCLKQFLFQAELISITPQTVFDDHIIKMDQLEKLLGDKRPEALIIRTRPNSDLKLNRQYSGCLLYTSPSPRDRTRSRMPSSA
mgnify:CR=1 FL=1